jgi:Predicted permeases
MFRIKKLYTFILSTFFPILLATFSVCVFILLMQFLWQHVDKMVGKGVGFDVLLELFFYAGLTFTPMALPLSILLASLMTFGNLGEHFELIAMKASGISLIQIMKPLIIVMIFVMGISFYFQNDLLPKAQVKMQTILLSLREKSPELDIPEGIFYKEIEGYNVYVKEKDKKTGLLKDMMIYDYSNGFHNAMVIVADSGRLKMSEDKASLILDLYSGESFENLKTKNSSKSLDNIPYRRETFSFRSIFIPFDTNFNMIDESIMGSREKGKNINQLVQYIDSASYAVDSISQKSIPFFKEHTYLRAFKQDAGKKQQLSKPDTLFAKGYQAYFDSQDTKDKINLIEKAYKRAERIEQEYHHARTIQADSQKQIRSHEMQIHSKLTLSLACLLFFFIGAPLGAIIGKGGFGLPVVVSVFIFLFYYTIDTFGMKMAKQGVWETWEGMWLSSAILLTLGTFFTYKAINDSTIMNPEAWKIYLNNLLIKLKLKKKKD